MEDLKGFLKVDLRFVTDVRNSDSFIFSILCSAVLASALSALFADDS